MRGPVPDTRSSHTRWLPLAGAALLLCTGCAALTSQNTAAFPACETTVRHDPKWLVMFKAAVLVPARDIVTLEPLWRRWAGQGAWNANGAGVSPSAFFTPRTEGPLTPAAAAAGPCTDPPPEPPIRILKTRTFSTGPGFLGEDARGRKFVFKFDRPDYPELATGATIIANRVLWALGYHVPAEYLVRVAGTGDPRFDGRRAIAALWCDDVRGHFHFDPFRHRRELRGLRMAAAWLNDVDRVGSNTLVTADADQICCYLVDFDSCLGSWQGRPKETWRGWRHEWSLGWTLLTVLSFGQAHPEPDPHQPIISPAVGRFDADTFQPLAWQPQVPNNAFDHLTSADLHWIAGQIARLGPEHVAAIVAAAQYSDPADAVYLTETLLRRQAKILALAQPPAALAPPGPATDDAPPQSPVRNTGPARGGR